MFPKRLDFSRNIQMKVSSVHRSVSFHPSCACSSSLSDVNRAFKRQTSLIRVSPIFHGRLSIVRPSVSCSQASNLRGKVEASERNFTERSKRALRHDNAIAITPMLWIIPPFSLCSAVGWNARPPRVTWNPVAAHRTSAWLFRRRRILITTCSELPVRHGPRCTPFQPPTTEIPLHVPMYIRTYVSTFPRRVN